MQHAILAHRSLHTRPTSLFALGACTCILFAFGSLMLANYTLTLQDERARLRGELETQSRAVAALRFKVVERQNLDVLKHEADLLGLIHTEHVRFSGGDASHLTQQ